MNLSNNVAEMIISAESKALATNNINTLNVVPVSTVKIVDNKIILVNYFMGKTLENIQQNPHVALACWKGLAGYQIKGTIEYIESGELLETIKIWVKEILPDRIVKGIFILTPLEVFDVSATIESAGKKIS